MCKKFMRNICEESSGKGAELSRKLSDNYSTREGKRIGWRRLEQSLGQTNGEPTAKSSIG